MAFNRTLLVRTICFFLIKDSVLLLCECFDSFEISFLVFAETVSFIEISWSSCFYLRKKSMATSFSITTSSKVNIRVFNSFTSNSKLSLKSNLFLFDKHVSAFLFSSYSNTFLLILQMI